MPGIPHPFDPFQAERTREELRQVEERRRAYETFSWTLLGAAAVAEAALLAGFLDSNSQIARDAFASIGVASSMVLGLAYVQVRDYELTCTRWIREHRGLDWHRICAEAPAPKDRRERAWWESRVPKWILGSLRARVVWPLAYLLATCLWAASIPLG